MCTHFVPYKFTDDQKLHQIQHCKDIVKEAKKEENFSCNIVTGGETWCFQYDPEAKPSKFRMHAKKSTGNQKIRVEKLQVMIMLICFYDAKLIVHHEFVSLDTKFHAPFYIGVLRW